MVLIWMLTRRLRHSNAHLNVFSNKENFGFPQFPYSFALHESDAVSVNNCLIKFIREFNNQVFITCSPVFNACLCLPTTTSIAAPLNPICVYTCFSEAFFFFTHKTVADSLTSGNPALVLLVKSKTLLGKRASKWKMSL